MERFNFTVIRRFLTIAKPYWFSEEKWRARGLLLLVLLCSLLYTGLSVLMNNQRGAMISALSAQDAPRFWHTMLVLFGVLLAFAPQYAGYLYLRDRLGLQWRRWLTQRFVDNYFQNQAYYHLNDNDADIDNPDQRIAEDIRSFTLESLAFVLLLLDSVLKVIAFSGVLWRIEPWLIVFLVLYALIGSLVTLGIFGRGLVRLNFAQLKKEADFRFGLVRLREHAEAIAFYKGEEREATEVKARFQDVFDNFNRLIFWQLNLNCVTNVYEFIPFMLPAIVVAPSIFAGDLEVGKVSEAQGAFIQVFFSLNLVVARFQELTAFGAGINRLYSFAERLEPELQPASPDPQEDSRIQLEMGERFAIANLTLVTPDHQRTLIHNLDLTLPTGQGLLIRGPSGCGKSSLLRAIATLWTHGTGTIYRPPDSDILFLPQQPYMILGTLKDQLLYPHLDSDIDPQTLTQTLQTVNLAELPERYGGFDTRHDWSTLLSLGEQQRLTFARLLLNHPKYAILDEATSALDLDNEDTLYQHLQASGTTYISVGHRPSLDQYHGQTLQLSPDQTWELTSSYSETGIA